MIIYKSNSIDVTRIDFCCETMAKNILLGSYTTCPWTDHPLVFHINNINTAYFPLRHCPNCGAKIETKLLLKVDEPRV
jgi:hypothetical protein